MSSTPEIRQTPNDGPSEERIIPAPEVPHHHPRDQPHLSCLRNHGSHKKSGIIWFHRSPKIRHKYKKASALIMPRLPDPVCCHVLNNYRKNPTRTSRATDIPNHPRIERNVRPLGPLTRRNQWKSIRIRMKRRNEKDRRTPTRIEPAKFRPPPHTAKFLGARIGRDPHRTQIPNSHRAQCPTPDKPQSPHSSRPRRRKEIWAGVNLPAKYPKETQN